MSQNVDENEEYELFDKDSKTGKKQDDTSLNESTSPNQLETTIVNKNNDHISISSTKLINSDEIRGPKNSISSIKPINNDFSGSKNNNAKQVQNIHKNSTESSNLVHQNSTDNSEKPVLTHQLQKQISTKNSNNNDNYNTNNKKTKFQKKRTFESRLSKHDAIYNQPHEVFVELAELRLVDDDYYNNSNSNNNLNLEPIYEWREVSRWIKYEQNIDLETNMWSKPFVGALVYQSLLYLKTGLQYGTVLLNSDHESFIDVIDEMVRDFVDSGHMLKENREQIKRTLLTQHRHNQAFNGGALNRKKSTISDFFPYGRRQSTFTSIDPNSGQASINTSRKNSSVQCSDYNLNKRNDKWTSEINLDNEKNSGIGSSGRLDSSVKFSEAKTGDKFSSTIDIPNKRRRSTIALLKNTINQSKLNKSDLNIKGLASDAEAFVAMVGVVNYLDRPVMGFVRLKNSQFIEDFVEVQIKVRFLFVLLGPKNDNIDYLEIGRCIGTLMTNKEFRDCAYYANDRRELIETITNFTNRSLCVVLPIGSFDDDLLTPVIDWMRNKLEKKLVKLDQEKKLLEKNSPSSKSKHINNNNYESSNTYNINEHGSDHIDMNNNFKNSGDTKKNSFNLMQDLSEVAKRKKSIFIYKSNHNVSDDVLSYTDAFDPFQRTGYLFGCLIKEIKYRYSRYCSDYTDALNLHCLVAFVFTFTVCIAPALSFGGILADKTNKWFGINEMLIATSLNGIIAGLFSGQPLMIFGPTGPFLVFEEMLYLFCKNFVCIEFLSVRCWVTIWVLIFTLIMLAFEGVYIIKYVTRFTEEIFAFLIASVFLMDAFKKIYDIFTIDPMYTTEFYCKNANLSIHETSPTNLTISKGLCSNEYNEIEHVSYKIHSPEPNIALYSLILLVGTCVVALALKKLRRSMFFGAYVRRTLSDVGILISIIFMVCVNNLIEEKTGLETQKLEIPESSWKPTKKRDWLVSPLGTKPENFTYWIPFAAIFPASLIFIVLFFEVELTQMILYGKNRKLKKGTGFSSDFLLSALMMNLNSFLGLPWTCAAPVRTLAHWASLTVYSKTYVPGEKAKLIDVKEQRLTNIAVHLAIGICLFGKMALAKIPIPVLFGIFLYFGIVSSSGTQLYERIKLLFIPSKYCPSVVYARGVRPFKRNCFTLIQILFIILLLSIKSFNEVSYVFPIILALLVPLRIFLLPKIFTNKELEQLDHHHDIEDNNMSLDFYELTHLPI